MHGHDSLDTQHFFLDMTIAEFYTSSNCNLTVAEAEGRIDNMATKKAAKKATKKATKKAAKKKK